MDNALHDKMHDEMHYKMLFDVSTGTGVEEDRCMM